MTDIVERLRVWPAGYGEDTLSSTVVGKIMKDAADEIERLQAIIAAAQSAWQPIETAPKDGTKILVWTVHGDVEISEWFVIPRHDYELVDADSQTYRKVDLGGYASWNSNNFTHWMPLPTEPALSSAERARGE